MFALSSPRARLELCCTEEGKLLRKRSLGSVEECNDALPSSWQSNVDLPTRREMMHTLMIVMKDKNTDNMLQEEYEKKLPTIVRRIELALYLRAASLNEYLNTKTLQRRVQYLVVTLHHHGRQQYDEMSNQGNPSKKLCLKKSQSITTSVKNAETFNSHLTLFNNTDLLRKVFSFLDGIEVITSMSTCRFTYHALPSCVRSLSININALQHLLDTKTIFKFSHLEELKVEHTRAIQGNQSVHKFDSRSASRLPYNDDNHGEKVVRDLAQALFTRSNVHLKVLSLNALFISTHGNDAVGYLTHALKSGCCPKLEALSLSGNCIGDRGAADVADMMQSKFCAGLQHLDLRCNFIGEAGFYHIAKMLGQTPARRIKSICLGKNIGTSDSILKLCASLDCGNLLKLNFLGVEDNFIEEDGMYALARTLKRESCIKIEELCIGDNALPNEVIHQIFEIVRQESKEL